MKEYCDVLNVCLDDEIWNHDNEESALLLLDRGSGRLRYCDVRHVNAGEVCMIMLSQLSDTVQHF